MIEQNEQIDDLMRDGLKIIQKKAGFRYGIDAVLLSDFVTCSDHAHVMDLGTGNGILPLLLYARKKGDRFVGIDSNFDAIEMAKRTIMLNGLTEHIDVQNIDVTRIREHFDAGSFDCVVTNPPYMRQGQGRINKDENKAIARHELTCTFDDIAKAACFLLKPKGSFFVVHRPHRLVDVFASMRNIKIEPKRIRFVYPKAHKEPNLVLVYGQKSSGCELRIEPNLIIYNDRGEYTEEILRIYGL